jgi:maleate isomerase
LLSCDEAYVWCAFVSDWKWKLGYVVPSWNTVVEYETTQMLPAGVSAHFSRISHANDSPDSLRFMTEQFPSHVELLSHAKVDVVCYACTGASLFRGRDHDLQDIARLRTADLKVISTAGALVDAAKHLQISRVAVAAPYEQWLLDCLVSYLEVAGLQVMTAIGLGQQANILHSPQVAIDLALRAWSPAADGLILSCGNFRSLESIPEIERSINKPVITSNTAALWGALTAAGWDGLILNAGHLLTHVGKGTAQREMPAVADSKRGFDD